MVLAKRCHQGDGLRAFPPDERDVERHECGRDRRHDRVSVAGAFPGQDRRRAQRPLQRRRRDVRSVHRHRAVQERVRRSGRRDLRARQRTAGRAAHDQPRRPGTDRTHRPATAGERSRTPLRFGARSDRRHQHAARAQQSGRTGPVERGRHGRRHAGRPTRSAETHGGHSAAEVEARSVLERTFGNTQTLNEGYANTLAGMLAARKRDWTEATRAYVAALKAFSEVRNHVEHAKTALKYATMVLAKGAESRTPRPPRSRERDRNARPRAAGAARAQPDRRGRRRRTRSARAPTDGSSPPLNHGSQRTTVAAAIRYAVGLVLVGLRRRRGRHLRRARSRIRSRRRRIERRFSVCRASSISASAWHIPSSRQPIRWPAADSTSSCADSAICSVSWPVGRSCSTSRSTSRFSPGAASAISVT